MSAELFVPALSRERLAAALNVHEWDSYAHLDEAARMVSTPVVTAELRRLADQLSAIHVGLLDGFWNYTRAGDDRNAKTMTAAATQTRAIQAMVVARADELEAGA